jgi:hypothetical protein
MNIVSLLRSFPGCVLALALSGCTDCNPRPLASPSLLFEPSDGATAVDAGVLTLEPALGFSDVPSHYLQELLVEAELDTWPSMSIVSTQHAFGNAQDGHAALLLTPLAPLPTAWYALRIRQLPSDFQEDIYPTYRHLPDGSLAARFHVGSLPTWLDLRASSDGATMAMDFSEPIGLSDTFRGSVSFTQAPGTPTCTQAAFYPPNRTVYWDCSGIEPGRPVTLSLGVGFQTDLGQSIVDMKGRGAPQALMFTIVQHGTLQYLFYPEDH